MDSTGRQTNTALLSCCTQNIGSQWGWVSSPSRAAWNCSQQINQRGIFPWDLLLSHLSVQFWCWFLPQSECLGLNWPQRSLCWGKKKNVVCKCFLHRNQNKALFPNRNSLRWVKESHQSCLLRIPGSSGLSQPFAGSNPFLQKKSWSHKPKWTKSPRSTSCL